MPKDAKETVSYRMSPDLVRRIKEYAAHFTRVSEKKYDRSDYVRDCVSQDLAMWRGGPYTATRSMNRLLVNRSGDFIFYRREALRFHDQSVASVTAGIGMKHEKIRDYLKSGVSGSELAKFFRLNLFICRIPLSTGERVIIKTDAAGVTSKTVEFPRLAGCNEVTIETIAILENYVQRCSDHDDVGQGSKDEAAIDVEIPTEKLDFVVVLDLDLYKGDSRRLDRIDDYDSTRANGLHLSLKNLRGATIVEGKELSNLDKIGFQEVDRFNKYWEKDKESDAQPTDSSNERYKRALGTTRDWLGDLQGILKDCREKMATCFKGVGEDRDRLREDLDAVLSASERYVYVPERARFYYMEFLQCRMGFRFAINWIKPEAVKGLSEQSTPQ